ncbi:MAG: hypothetical protein WCJ94_01350 [bacterium]
MKTIHFIFAMLFTLLLFTFYSCSTRIGPTTPVASGIKMSVSIQTINNSNAVYMTQYGAVITDASGNSISGATITVTSANGTFILTEPTPGLYIYQNGGASAYIEAQDYEINIAIASTTYTALSKAPGGITLAADGSNASWLSEGNLDMLTILYPASSGQQILGPDLVSPLNISATGAYNHGSGTYSLGFIFTKTITNAFTNASTQSTLTFQDEYAVQIIK